MKKENKFKINPIAITQDEVKEEEEQKKLHEKYKDVKEDVKIIETSNSYKFTINTLKNIFHTFFSIVIYVLATIGVMTLIYPETREYILNVFVQIINTYF